MRVCVNQSLIGKYLERLHSRDPKLFDTDSHSYEQVQLKRHQIADQYDRPHHHDFFAAKFVDKFKELGLGKA